MKKYFLIFTLASICLLAQVKYDTISTSFVCSGIKYSKLLEKTVPWSIHVLEIDLKNPYIKIESFKAANLSKGNERTSVMAKQNSFAGHKVVAAVNGDFYHAGGIPTNIQVRNGQIISPPITRTIIAFDVNNKPIMNSIKFSGKILKDNSSYKLDGVNIPRNANQLVLLNRYFGETTGTNSSGREVLVQRVSRWIVNDTVKCIVKKIQIGIGNMLIPDTTYAVISAEGSATDFTKSVRIGDTIKVLTTISPSLPKIKEAIGGFIQVVNKGKDYVDQSYLKENKPGHALLRHPRTGIGFSKDSTKLYLVAIDGRQTHSVGMTLHELADLMIKIGVHYGLNLDGGGSTTMVVKDSVVNIPSDGKERSVSNGLLIISTKPENN
ncbi:MAG: phosphodiester glycosidase family protein [Melioribacteraceae bacterium]